MTKIIDDVNFVSYSGVGVQWYVTLGFVVGRHWMNRPRSLQTNRDSKQTPIKSNPTFLERRKIRLCFTMHLLGAQQATNFWEPVSMSAASGNPTCREWPLVWVTIEPVAKLRSRFCIWNGREKVVSDLGIKFVREATSHCRWKCTNRRLLQTPLVYIHPQIVYFIRKYRRQVSLFAERQCKQKFQENRK